MYLNEDFLSQHVISKNGLVLTRSEWNLETFDIHKTKPFLTILTGYPNILSLFFQNILPKIQTKIVLIIIESDIINLYPVLINNPKINHCFTWNKTLEHYKISCMPIGLNYKKNYVSTQKILSEYSINENVIRNPNKLLCFNCDLNTNIERKRLNQILNEKLKGKYEKVKYIKPISTIAIPSNIEGNLIVNITNPDVYKQMLNYKFILSPAGEGLDCHRTWEAIILGCIPIVKKSSIDEIFDNLPVLILNDWDELNEEFLNEKYNRIMLGKKYNIFDYQKLYLKYWLKKFNDFL